MLEKTDFSDPVQRFKMSILIAATGSAICTALVYFSAAFGSEGAMNLLLDLSLPKYNVFANLIPTDLSGVKSGMEMILGTIILQFTVVLSAIVFFTWSAIRK